MSTSLNNYRWVHGWHLNAVDVLFGGQLMSWCDEDASMLVRNQMREGRLTTAGADRIRFISPVEQGERLRFDSEIVHVGKASMTVLSKVWALYDYYKRGQETQVYEQYTTLASINSMNYPCPWYLLDKELGEAIKKNPQWDVVVEMRKHG